MISRTESIYTICWLYLYCPQRNIIHRQTILILSVMWYFSGTSTGFGSCSSATALHLSKALPYRFDKVCPFLKIAHLTMQIFLWQFGRDMPVTLRCRKLIQSLFLKNLRGNKTKWITLLGGLSTDSPAFEWIGKCVSK